VIQKKIKLYMIIFLGYHCFSDVAHPPSKARQTKV
jgi:hypothetical protein